MATNTARASLVVHDVTAVRARVLAVRHVLVDACFPVREVGAGVVGTREAHKPKCNEETEHRDLST